MASLEGGASRNWPLRLFKRSLTAPLPCGYDRDLNSTSFLQLNSWRAKVETPPSGAGVGWGLSGNINDTAFLNFILTFSEKGQKLKEKVVGFSREIALMGEFPQE